MLYALMCTDKPDGLQMRMDTRPEHVQFLKSLGDDLAFAGPFLGDDEKPNGSLVVIKANDLAHAKDIAAQDPYAKVGLFSNVEIRAWNWALKNPETS